MNAPYRSLLSVSDIAAQLTARAEDVFLDIFPNAVRDGHELCVGDIHGSTGKTLRMHIGGAKPGLWKDFNGADDHAGDVLKLVQLTVAGGDMGRAVAWAKLFLGIDEGDRAAIERHRIEAAARREASARDAAEAAEAMRRAAVARWHQGRPIVRDDPVWRYLAARGIDLSRLSRAPGAIRFHPDLQYGRQEPGGPKPWRGPAMVAMVNALDGTHIATHRTFLTQRGGVWTKAGAAEIGTDSKGRARNAKTVLGACRGGHIHLWKGGDDKPLKAMAPGRIHAGEGIEDALTAAVADPTLRCIAYISAGNLIDLALPEQMEALVILKQNDPPGSDAARSLIRATAAHRRAGRRVLFVEVPQGVKDINDLARGGAA